MVLNFELKKRKDKNLLQNGSIFKQIHQKRCFFTSFLDGLFD
jgi:hypothetical protein